jgi:ABC-2 type transport system ATP-binding protein
MLDVRGLEKTFGDLKALDGVDLRVDRGQLVGFLGPNGAGKTTTMRAILGLVAIDGGTITWDGAPITEAVRRRIGYMPAERGMYPKMRVRDQVVYFARLSSLSPAEAGAAADKWIDRVGLTDRADTPVQDLSSGNQQRVQLAIALVSDPELLVLDEPFSGLDPVAVDVLKDVLLERVKAGAALLFSSHQLDLIEDISRDVVIIDQGRVVLSGDVADLRRQAAHRYVDVTFDGAVSWQPQVGELVPVAEPHVQRVRVDRGTDPADVLADAQRAGVVTSFGFFPPELSEVFLRAVGRTTVDADVDAAVDADVDVDPAEAVR